MVPAFLLRANQHQFETALPDDAAAEPFEHRAAFAPIGRVGVRASRLAAVGIGGLGAQPDQIEHVDGPRTVIGAELREDFLGRIDMPHGGTLPAASHALPILTRAAPRPNRALTFS